jgi:hypothetical protein
MNKCRCDERLQTKTKEFTRLPYTGLVLELEHLKIETRLIIMMFASGMGTFVILLEEVGGHRGRVYVVNRTPHLQRIFNDSPFKSIVLVPQTLRMCARRFTHIAFPTETHNVHQPNLLRQVWENIEKNFVP